MLYILYCAVLSSQDLLAFTLACLFPFCPTIAAAATCISIVYTRSTRQSALWWRRLASEGFLSSVACALTGRRVSARASATSLITPSATMCSAGGLIINFPTGCWRIDTGGILLGPITSTGLRTRCFLGAASTSTWADWFNTGVVRWTVGRCPLACLTAQASVHGTTKPVRLTIYVT